MHECHFQYVRSAAQGIPVTCCDAAWECWTSCKCVLQTNVCELLLDVSQAGTCFALLGSAVQTQPSHAEGDN